MVYWNYSATNEKTRNTRTFLLLMKSNGKSELVYCNYFATHESNEIQELFCYL